MEGTDKGMGNPNTTGEVRCGTILKVAGPLIVATGMSDVEMFDVVRVSEKRLIGEVIELRGDKASIQVYEETAGLGPGEPVYSTGEPLSVELAPGLIESIFDGIQRPLNVIYAEAGDRIPRGIEVPKLDREKKWEFVPVAKIGDKLIGGDVLGTVQETPAVEQKIMMPPRLSGTVEWIHTGEATIVEPIAKVRKEDGTLVDVPMLQRWPADIIVYIGCGERGNEMTDVLREFPELHDPRTGLSLMKRTVLIANTSDMPVAAREASIYTGITIAEYFRDMGYRVAIMADSTSRWAEALREMSGRLEEMPGEEGYPAYLGSRLAEFYERAGFVRCIGSEERYGAISAIGAVSPPGGDTSEPVSQATLRIVKVFWGLSSDLAYKRHFPAIDWLTSYSLYSETMAEYFDQNVASDWSKQVAETRRILQEESELQEVVRLVGVDALAVKDRMTLEAARSIREDYLHQIAFDDVDTYTSPAKQYGMLHLILAWYHKGEEAVAAEVPFEAVMKMPALEQIGRMKRVPEDQWDSRFASISKELEDEFAALMEEDRDHA